MTLILPTWLLWAGAIVGGLVVLGLAVLGVVLILVVGKWRGPSW